MVKKPDGNWRKCVDYRQLNQATVDMSYPISNYEEILDSLGGNKYFAKLDLVQGFLQIPLDSSASNLTTFTTPFGLFKY